MSISKLSCQQAFFVFVGLLFYFILVPIAYSQEKKCNSTKECAQRAVDIANQLDGIIRKQEAEVNQLRKDLDFIRKDILAGIDFFQSDRKTQSGPGSWFAECPEQSKVVSGYCQLNGPPLGSHGPNASLQNVGISGNGWHCNWRDTVINPTIFAWCARMKR